VTKQTKRDWHALLDYNRHDCLALRHIYLKASFELGKWREYEQATYCVEADGNRTICFRVGGNSPRLDAFLDRSGAERWAFLTAWNPASEQLRRAENDRRQQELIDALQDDEYQWRPGEGRGRDPSWPPERSVFVLNLSTGAARALGRRFGQLAVLVGQRGGNSKLISCL
jgi:hypothetical protein